MEHKALPDFQTYQERDKYFLENADYFTVIKKDGVGYYDRTELKALAQAQAVVKLKQTLGGGNFLIYAVIGQQSALVQGKAASSTNPGQEATNDQTKQHSNPSL